MWCGKVAPFKDIVPRSFPSFRLITEMLFDPPLTTNAAGKSTFSIF
jgi:hypothetical protein